MRGPLAAAVRLRWAAALAVAFLLAVPSGGSADKDEALVELVDAVQRRYESVRDLEAEFVQESLLLSIGETQRHEGRVYFKKPGRMRWEYLRPDRQTIVGDGEKFWIHVPDDKQVIVQTAEGLGLQNTFLLGLGNLRRDFRVGWARPLPGEESYHHLKLTPLRPQPNFTKLVLVVDKESHDIVGTDVFDLLDNRTSIRLRNIQVNRGIPDKKFRFKAPKGVEVIDASEAFALPVR